MTDQDHLWDSMGQVPSGPPGAGAPPQRFADAAPPPPGFGPPPTSDPIPGDAPDFGSYEPDGPPGGGFSAEPFDGDGPQDPIPQPQGDGGSRGGGIKALLGRKVVRIGAAVAVLGVLAVVGVNLLGAKDGGVTPLPVPSAAGDDAGGDAGVVEMPAPDEVEDLVEFEGEAVVEDTEGVILEGEPPVEDEESAEDVEAELEAARQAAEEEISGEQVPDAGEVETYEPDDEGVVIGDPETTTSSVSTSTPAGSSSGSSSPRRSSGSSEVSSPSGPVGRVTVNHTVSCRTDATVYLTAVGKGEVEMSADGAIFSGSGEATTTVHVQAGSSVSASASADDDVQIRWRARGRCA